MKAMPEMKWSSFLKLFSEQNRNRPTRIAVFEGLPGDMNDYWLEDGLPLAGVDVDPDGEDGLEVEILLGDTSDPDAHMTRRVRGVRFARITLSADGESDGLELGTRTGESTVLRFETAAKGGR